MSGTQIVETRGGLRLRIEPATSFGKVAGFWWPHSRDFRAEVEQLAEHFPTEFGRIMRVLYSTPDWDFAPDEPKLRWLKTGQTRIKVGSFPADDTSLLIVHTDREERLVLLVIPPGATRKTLSESVQNGTAGNAIHAEYAAREIDPLAGWLDDGGHIA